MLTHQQIVEFERLGILRVEGAISAAATEAMCACVWDNLSRRYAFRCDQPDTWTPKRVNGFNALDKSANFERAIERWDDPDWLRFRLLGMTNPGYFALYGTAGLAWERLDALTRSGEIPTGRQVGTNLIHAERI